MLTHGTAQIRSALARSLSAGSAPGSAVRSNRFKAAIAQGDRQVGLWTGLRSTLVAEMLSTVSGFDWFVIDMEHSPNELNDVLLQLQVSQHGAAEPVHAHACGGAARPGWYDVGALANRNGPLHVLHDGRNGGVRAV